ncbi:MAG: hypothetical protein JW780_08260 [Clostridiales bacterium]|nr:hypothetical protein [Clostridiales bacterium]
MLEKVMKNKAPQMSGGQQQRTAIARRSFTNDQSNQSANQNAMVHMSPTQFGKK